MLSFYLVPMMLSAQIQNGVLSRSAFATIPVSFKRFEAFADKKNTKKSLTVLPNNVSYYHLWI